MSAPSGDQSQMQLTTAGSTYSGAAYINWPFPDVPMEPAITGNIKWGSQTGMVIFFFSTVPTVGPLTVGDVGTTDVQVSYSGPSGATMGCNGDPATHGNLMLTAFSAQQVSGTFSFVTEGSTCPGPVEVSAGSFSIQPTMWYPYGGG